MKTLLIYITTALCLFFTPYSQADYAGDGKEFEWKESQKEAVKPLIIGKWIDKKASYQFSANGTYKAYYKDSKITAKGFWREDSTGKIYFCNDEELKKTSLFTLIGYVKGNTFIEDHICYSHTYTKVN